MTLLLACGTVQIRDRKKEMEEKYLTVVEEHVDRLGEMAKNIQEVGPVMIAMRTNSRDCSSMRRVLVLCTSIFFIFRIFVQ